MNAEGEWTGTTAGLALGMERWSLTLLGNVKPLSSVGVLVLASEELPEDGIISDERSG